MHKKLFLSLLCGVALSLAFPPFKLGFFAYVGLIPFLIILKDTSYKQAAKWGYLTGLFINMGTLHWINWVTIPGTIAAILYLPIFFVLFAVFHTFIRFRLGQKYLYLTIPFLWTGIEYIRTIGVLGFPWTSLAYTQTYYLSLIQYASYTSVYGISFWIVTINVVIIQIFNNYHNYKKATFYFILLIALFLFPWFYGKIVIPDDTKPFEENIKVALIQGNIDPFIKSDIEFWEENFNIHDSLTSEAMKYEPQLVIWPETAVPCYLRHNQFYRKNLKELVEKHNIPLLTGAHDYKFITGDDYLNFNSAFLITPGSFFLPVYAKLHLVPFGERVPFTESLPQFKNFLESLEFGEGNFSPGDEIVTFNVPISLSDNQKKTIKVPLVICFESLFPELVRKFVINDHAQMLVIITNDGWFKRSAAPYHHAQAAVFRAIENRISIARCANTGISMFIDPYGRTITDSPIFERTYLVARIPLKNDTTFFSTYGNIFTIAVTISNIIPLLIALLLKNQEVINA